MSKYNLDNNWNVCKAKNIRYKHNIVQEEKFRVQIMHPKLLLNSIKHSYICGEDMMLLFGHWKGLGKSLNFIFGWLLLQIGNRVDFSICILCELTWNITSHLDETQTNSEVMSNLILTPNKMATKLKRSVTNTIWSRKKNSALR